MKKMQTRIKTTFIQLNFLGQILTTADTLSSIALPKSWIAELSSALMQFF